MKTQLIALLTMHTLSQTANATSFSRFCFAQAEKAAANQAVANNYDVNGFEAHICSLAPNSKAIICEVSASKGHGAATDTYRVVMNTTCHKVFRVDLIGEE